MFEPGASRLVSSIQCSPLSYLYIFRVFVPIWRLNTYFFGSTRSGEVGRARAKPLGELPELRGHLVDPHHQADLLLNGADGVISAENRDEEQLDHIFFGGGMRDVDVLVIFVWIIHQPSSGRRSTPTKNIGEGRSARTELITLARECTNKDPSCLLHLDSHDFCCVYCVCTVWFYLYIYMFIVINIDALTSRTLLL